MALYDLSTTAASNTASPPTGAPEGSTVLGDVSNLFREVMAVIRGLAAADTLAAGATTDLGSKGYATFITLSGGATTISGFGTVAAGIWKVVIYNAAHTLTYNATSMILLGNASRTVAAGDIGLYVSEGSGNWRELFFSSDTGSAYLSAIGALTPTDSNIIVGNGTTWVAESGATARASLGLTIGTNVQAYDADTLKADVTDALVAGFTATSTNAGTKSSGTYTPTVGNSTSNFQYAVNGGAHTLAPPVGDCTVVIQYTNNASAGAITTSGWTKVTGSFTTTNGDDFLCYGTVVGSFSHLTIVALQ